MIENDEHEALENLDRKPYLDVLQSVMSAAPEVRKKRVTATWLSQKMKVSPSYVHRLIRGKTPISLERAYEMAEILEMGAFEKEQFIKSVVASLAKRSRSEVARSLEGEPGGTANDQLASEEMDAHLLNTFCEWHYFAILDFVSCESFRSDVSWVARALRLDEVIVADAVAKLQLAGLLDCTGGKWEKTSRHLSFSRKFSFGQLAKIHRGLMNRASEEMQKTSRQDLERRDVTGTTMAIDVKKIAKVKEEIRIFRKRITSYLTTSNCTEVYHLGVQLFPLSEVSEGGKTS